MHGLTQAPTAMAAATGHAIPSNTRAARPRTLRAIVIVADQAAVTAGMLAAFGLSQYFYLAGGHRAGTTTLLFGGASLPLWWVVFTRYRLYNARCLGSRLDEFGRLIHAVLASTVLAAALSFWAHVEVSRGWLVLCFFTVLTTCCIEREVVRRRFSMLRRTGRLLRTVVVVGTNAEAESLCQLLATCPGLGYRVVGIVGDDDPRGDPRQVPSRPVLGRIEDTLAVARAAGVTGVIVATTAVTSAASNRLVRELTEAGLHVELSSSLDGISAERLTVRALGTSPVFYIEPARRGGMAGAAKRAFDVGASVLALIVLSPALAAVAVAVKLDSRGPVLFSQMRVGKDGRPFKIFKFRTMVDDAEALLVELRAHHQNNGPLFKLHDDPRVTRIGRVLRRFSVDEIPQLWNVVRAEMSLVGPRPALYEELEHWSPELRSRLRVRPGLTGMWQVSGRSNLTFADYVRFDLYYVDNWTLWRDLAILGKTIPVVLGKKGAY